MKLWWTLCLSFNESPAWYTPLLTPRPATKSKHANKQTNKHESKQKQLPNDNTCTCDCTIHRKLNVPMSVQLFSLIKTPRNVRARHFKGPLPPVIHCWQHQASPRALWTELSPTFGAYLESICGFHRKSNKTKTGADLSRCGHAIWCRFGRVRAYKIFS